MYGDSHNGPDRDRTFPEIGSPAEDVPEEAEARRVFIRLAPSLILSAILTLFGLTLCEYVNHRFLPAWNIGGLHVGTILLGVVTVPVVLFFVLKRYRDLLAKRAGEITDRLRAEKALRESEELYRAVVENVADGIAITVGNERVMVNRAFLKIHGLSESSRDRGLPFDKFIIPEDREAVRQRVEARQRGEVLDGIAEYRIRRNDGEIRTLQASVGLVKYKGLPGTLAVLRDVTEMKEAQTRIMELNGALETHVQNLEAANRDLEAFNSMVSHDLRIPLITIQGFARRLWERREEMPDRWREWVALIRSGADRMGHLIEDLLGYSRLGKEALEFGVLPMETIVEDVVLELKPLYPKSRVKVGPLPDAYGDRRMMRQLVTNLLSNALKFSTPNPAPLIEVEGREGEEENLYSVSDNGVGFDMGEREKIFSVFHRLHSRDEFEGTGVGLAIVRRIATLHQGRVWAEGQPGKGATFFFTLPRRSPGH